PLYIESSNQTSLPEVKRIIVSYGDEIVMDRTLDEALDRLLELVDPDVKKKEDSTKKETDKNETEKPEKNQEAEKQLQKIADLLKQYKKAVSEGNWEESGNIMKEIEKKL